MQADSTLEPDKDHYNIDRIQKFDSYGKFITKWGSPGTGDGNLHNPIGITTDSSGNVYVVDGLNNRIQKFDSDGKFITKWGSPGTGDGKFSTPEGIATDSSGNVYVSDSSVSLIQKFNLLPNNTGTTATTTPPTATSTPNQNQYLTWFKQGLGLLKSGMYNEALGAFDKALSI